MEVSHLVCFDPDEAVTVLDIVIDFASVVENGNPSAFGPDR